MTDLVRALELGRKDRLVLAALTEGRVVDGHWALANGIYSITKAISRIRAKGYRIDLLQRPHGISQYAMA